MVSFHKQKISTGVLFSIKEGGNCSMQRETDFFVLSVERCRLIHYKKRCVTKIFVEKI